MILSNIRCSIQRICFSNHFYIPSLKYSVGVGWMVTNSIIQRTKLCDFHKSRFLVLELQSRHGSHLKIFNYPFPRRDESIVDSYFGVKVKDPYRWLEDPDSEETAKFVDDQNILTRSYLDRCPVRAEIKSCLTQLWNYPKYSCPYRHGQRHFFYKNSGLQNQSVMYVQDSLDSEPQVFLDPNVLSEDGTVALSQTRFSEDGDTLAYAISRSGSDWLTIHFKDVASGKDFPEVLEKVKFSPMAWTHDNKGIFYGRYPEQKGKADGSETESNQHQKLYYHRVGTSQDEDILCVEFPDEPLWSIGAEVSDCGRWLIVMPQKDCRDNLVYFCDLSSLPNGEVSGLLNLTKVVDKMEAQYQLSCFLCFHLACLK